MRLLDLFCGAGGAATGYHRAGFDDITGVDIKPMPRYPFRFIQGDALEYLAAHGHEYDVIHASPPCQHYSWSAARWGKDNYPDLVDKTRKMLDATGKPYIIENVIGAPLRNRFILDGQMFGLGVIRKRQFESNLFIFGHPPVPVNGSVKDGDIMTVAGHGGDGRAALHLWKKAMGIDWMSKVELTQAIPPAYTEFIGKQLLERLR